MFYIQCVQLILKRFFRGTVLYFPNRYAASLEVFMLLRGIHQCMCMKINQAAKTHSESELVFQQIMHIMSAPLSGTHYCNCRISRARVPTAEAVLNLSCGRFLQWLPSEEMRRREASPVTSVGLFSSSASLLSSSEHKGSGQGSVRGPPLAETEGIKLLQDSLNPQIHQAAC